MAAYTIVLALVLCLALVYSNVPMDPPSHIWEAARVKATHAAIAQTGMARMSGINHYEVFVLGLDKEGLQEIASVPLRRDGTVISAYRIMRGTPLPGMRVMFALGVAGTVACLVLAWRFRRVMAASLRRPTLRPPADLP
ncbi:MAG: hypothetical protein Q8P31_13450 [Bacillota bacterium]|nr:hypothetical protein [Bacillota bacterium]